METVTETEYPKSIALFRRIINHVKRGLLENQYDENADEADVQNISNLKNAIQRIQQFGNILMVILKKPVNHVHEHKSVRDLFKNNHFHFEKLSDEEGDLCEHFVDNDVYKYPFDLSPLHMDVLQK